MNERHVDCQWCRIGKTVNWNICVNFRPRVFRRSLARLFGLVKAVKIRNHGSSVADTLSGAFTGEFILHTPIGFYDLLRPQRGWFRWFAIGFYLRGVVFGNSFVVKVWGYCRNGIAQLRWQKHPLLSVHGRAGYWFVPHFLDHMICDPTKTGCNAIFLRP